jgi:hypothetical protein
MRGQTPSRRTVARVWKVAEGSWAKRDDGEVSTAQEGKSEGA